MAPPPVLQRRIDDMQAYGRLVSSDAQLADLVFQLDTHLDRLVGMAGGLSESQQRAVTAAARARQAMERSGYSGATVLAFARAAFAAGGALATPGPFDSPTALEGRREQNRAVSELTRQILRHGPVSEAVEEDRSEREEAEARQAQRRTTQEITRYLRRGWSSIRDAPTVGQVAVRGIIERNLGADAVAAYVADPPGAGPELATFLQLLFRNPRAIQRNNYEILRGVVLAIGGEWADIIVPGDMAAEAERLEDAGVELTQEQQDRMAAARVTGEGGETGLQAEVAGTTVDLLITLIPGLDQVGDVRDVGANLFALLNADGRRPNECREWTRWLNFTLTCIGAAPTLGSAVKWAGGLVTTGVRRAGGAVGPIVARALDPVAAGLRRFAPEVGPFVDDLVEAVVRHWSRFADAATSAWSRTVDLVDRFTDSAVAALTPVGRRIQDSWRQARALAPAMMASALAELRRLLTPLFEGVQAALRRGGIDLVDIAAQARRMGEAALEHSRAAREAASQRVRAAIDLALGSTAEWRALEAEFEAMRELERRMERAIDIGDMATVERLAEEMRGLATSFERRIELMGAPAVGEGAPEVHSATATATTERADSGATTDGADTADAASAGPTLEPEPGASRPASADAATEAEGTGHQPEGTTPGQDGASRGRDGAAAAQEGSTPDAEAPSVSDASRHADDQVGATTAVVPATEAQAASRRAAVAEAEEGEGVVPVVAASRRDPLRAPPGTQLDPGTLESDFGMPPANQRQFQEVADRHQVELDVRPTNRQAPELLDAGHLPKPEYIKAKSITDLDILIGARREDVGLVGYFRPHLPVRPEGMSDEVWAELSGPRGPAMRRYRERLDEYGRLQHTMEQLQLPPRARERPYRRTHPYSSAPQLEVDANGVIRIHGQTTRDGVALGFTGDHDVFDIRNADGTPVSPELYAAVIADMEGRGMGVLHGAHMFWRPEDSTNRGIFVGIVERHQEGGEALVRFAPGGAPRTAYARPLPPAEPLGPVTSPEAVAATAADALRRGRRVLGSEHDDEPASPPR